jgi:hypothetical protein
MMKAMVAKISQVRSLGKPVNASKLASAPSRNTLIPDGNIAALFGPDSLLPVEFFQLMRRKTILEPETKLMLAILADAIDCVRNNLLGRRMKTKRLFNEAAAWIFAVDTEWIFSFDNICEHLALDPMCVRRDLLGWMEKALANRSLGRTPQPN